MWYLQIADYFDCIDTSRPNQTILYLLVWPTHLTYPTVLPTRPTDPTQLTDPTYRSNLLTQPTHQTNHLSLPTYLSCPGPCEYPRVLATRFLKFEFTTLPYPTRNWKTTTRRCQSHIKSSLKFPKTLLMLSWKSFHWRRSFSDIL